MHVADGILSPVVCLGTGVLAAGAAAYSLKRLNDSPSLRAVPLTGMMAALVFAGQMVNFPIGAPVSGHLLGGLLAAIILGPWGGCLAMSLVLFMQWALFADGGRYALGANILNMGVVGAVGGYAIYASIRRWLGGEAGVLVGGIVAAWISVMAASSLFCVEFGLSHPDAVFGKSGMAEMNLSRIFGLMTIFHSLIGIGEALITGLVLSTVLVSRPDLIYTPEKHTGPIASAGRVLSTGFVAALAVAAFLAPFHATTPDGLEYVGQQAGFDTLQQPTPALWLADYELPIPGTVAPRTAADAAADQAALAHSDFWQRVAVSLAGIVGTSSVFIMAWLFTRNWQRRRLTWESSHGV